MDNNKIQLSALGALTANEERYIQIGEATVGVTPILSYEDLFKMIEWCVDRLIDDRPFVSTPLKEIIKHFAILKFYTNLDFSFLEKDIDMSNIYLQYDYIQRFYVLETIMPLIDSKQLDFFERAVDGLLTDIIAYRNSAVGICNTLAANAKNNTQDMQSAIDFLNEGENAEKMAALMKLTEELSGNQTPEKGKAQQK